VTVLETIQRGSEFLARKGVDSPRLQIELLLEHVLQLPRLKLYLNFERPVTDSETATLRELIRRRGEREPLQHILGSTCFCGIDIMVNRHVLIPRPETELLAERAWKFIESWPPGRAVQVLDFGTGSGCLALLLALKCPQAEIHAIDISPEALEVAKANANRHPQVRIQFHAGDGFNALPPGQPLDLIVSNPPYVPAGEIPSLQPEVRDHDPRLALDGGKDGLDFYRRLAVEPRPFLNSRATLMTEIGDGQGEAVKGILEMAGWRVESVELDYSKRERMVIAHRSD